MLNQLIGQFLEARKTGQITLNVNEGVVQSAALTEHHRVSDNADRCKPDTYVSARTERR